MSRFAGESSLSNVAGEISIHGEWNRPSHSPLAPPSNGGGPLALNMDSGTCCPPLVFPAVQCVMCSEFGCVNMLQYTVNHCSGTIVVQVPAVYSCTSTELLRVLVASYYKYAYSTRQQVASSRSYLLSLGRTKHCQSATNIVNTVDIEIASFEAYCYYCLNCWEMSSRALRAH
jgi:hypothetical protein